MSEIKKMEEREETTTTRIGGGYCWWWSAASSGQLALGIYSYKKGTAGACRMMPLRAFFVSSLIVGSGACAAMASLHASGVHTLEDMKVIGANIRTAIRAPPPRVQKDG